MKTGRKNRVLYTMLAAVLGASIVFPRQALSPRAAAEETDISAIGGLQVHLDAQSIAGVNNGAAVEKVENKAASTLQGAGDAVQTNTARRPAYIAQGRINGKPALRFQANSCMQIGADTGFYLDDMTVFVVANFSALPEHGEILSRVAVSAPWNHNWFFNIENGQFNYGWSTKSGGNYSYPQSKVALAENTSYVLSSKKSGKNGSLSINGVSAAAFTGSGSENDLSVPVTLGGYNANDSCVGDIGEVLIFDRGLTDAEALTVEKYLEGRWGMQDVHEGQLSDIKIKGETISRFRADRTEYALLKQGALEKSDIEFTTWNAADTAKLVQDGDTYKIEVTGAITQKKVVYTLDFQAMNYDYNEIKRLSSNEVSINDGFWSDLYKQYSTYTVNYMFDMFDKSKSFDNFDRVAAGEKKVLGNTSEHAAQILRPDNDRDVYNTTWTWINEPWREGLIYEGIRAAGEFVTVNRSDAAYENSVRALTERVNGYIDRIYAAALKTTSRDGNGKPIDGYFSTFTILDRTCVIDETDVTARYHHDLYNYGCLTEAAVYWYNATGDTRLLFAATRFTEFLIDYINGRDGFQGYKVVPPHELPEEALQTLYDLYKSDPDLVTLMEEKYSKVDGLSGEDRYYDLKIRLEEYKKIAASWITDRGNSEGRYNETNYGVYAQDNVSYSELTEALGHAVRANLWYNGIAYIGNRQENAGFVEAARSIWQNIVSSQMYVTGGTGSTNDGEEAYGGTDQLPHDGYCETCASVAMAFFSQNMFDIFGTAEYIDVVEKEMYNGILGCLGLDGNSFYYTNPMVSDDYTRPMFSNATPCCVPMYLKYYSELPEILYAKTDDTLFVNQFVSSSAQTRLGEKSVSVIQKTDLPNGDKALLSVTADGEFTLKLRMPSWASGVSVKVNGKAIGAKAGADGYIDVAVKAGETLVKAVYEKEILRVHQDYADANEGMVAIQYGPFVYCAEETDNTFSRFGNALANPQLILSSSAAIRVEYTETVFAIKIDGKTKTPIGVNLLKANAGIGAVDVELTLVPFYLRGNREKGYMKVWFNESVS